MSSRNPHTLGVWGTGGVRVKSKSFIANLRKWNREAQAAGKVVSVFPSLCDPFEDRPELEPWRQEMFAMLDECQFFRLLLLTKRPENVRRMWPRCEEDYEDDEGIAHATYYRPHVWLGCSVSNQETADRLVPELLKCRDLVPVLFVSAEPLLGPINLRLECPGCALCWASKDGVTKLGQCYEEGASIDWVIAGGESGPKARPMHPDWARSLRDQCQAAGVPFFFKQWGEWLPTSLQDWTPDQITSFDDGVRMWRHGYLSRKWEPEQMRKLNGREWSEFPQVEAAHA
jgi:protein gp37